MESRLPIMPAVGCQTGTQVYQYIQASLCAVPAKQQAHQPQMFRLPVCKLVMPWGGSPAAQPYPNKIFYGMIFNKRPRRGRISILLRCFRFALLPLPAQGNQPGRLHHSSSLGCMPGWAVPAPARLQRRSPERRADRNTGGTDATGTAEGGSGANKKRLDFAPTP